MAAGARPLGIIAGRGDLSRRIAEACRAEGRPYHVIALRGFADGWERAHPHTVAALVAVGRILTALRGAGCRDVLLAGGVDRPRLDPRALDAKALTWLPRLLPALRQGDDGLLRAVRALLEAEGFAVIAPSDVLDLRVEQGQLGRVGASEVDMADIRRGETILAALAPVDVSQACVVAESRVLGIETVQGTDALIAFVGRTRDLAQGAQGGVLVKRAKADQDPDMDAPTIGPHTVDAARAAGLRGIALEAQAVQIVDRAATVAAADAAGLFLLARP